MKKKPTYYDKDILSVFDFVFDQLFLSEAERRILLKGYDPAEEKFGESPKDPIEFWHYSQQYVECLLNLKALHKPVVDRVIWSCIQDWPDTNPELHLSGLTKEQLYILDARIGEARGAIQSKKYPRKTKATELDRNLDWFFPIACLKALLDT